MRRMARATSSPSADAESMGSVDDVSELRALSAAVRMQLRWLETGGVSGLPRPQRRAPRLPAPAPQGGVIEHTMPPMPSTMPSARPPAMAPPGPRPMPSSPLPERPAPVAPPNIARPLPTLKRPPVLEEVTYPEMPALSTLQGPEGLSTVRRVLGDCRRCKLCHGRNNLVFDDGAGDAWLVFVGEGPGADEDRLGKPFVGAAGQLLDRMIDAMAGEAKKRGHDELAKHLTRQSVYICNVVKCRPPGNRTPDLDEVGACTPFLRGQLASLRPTVRAIVALGRTPTQYLLKTSAPIGSLRGRFTDWEGIPVMPTFHPAYLLRTPSAKRQVWEDLQKVIEVLTSPSTIS
jgi:uracil-DNA glycosylase family 4